MYGSKSTNLSYGYVLIIRVNHASMSFNPNYYFFFNLFEPLAYKRQLAQNCEEKKKSSKVSTCTKDYLRLMLKAIYTSNLWSFKSRDGPHLFFLDTIITNSYDLNNYFLLV